MTRRLLIALIALISSLAVAEQNVAPGINDSYENADVDQWRSIFESDGREIWDRRQDILNALNLRSGMRVADIGAGTGFFTLMFAKTVGPEGKAYAVDISSSFIYAIGQRAREAGLGNVAGVVNNQQSVKLPAEAVDLAFVSDTYHHFEYPQTTLVSIHKALKPTGELVVIDFKKIPGLSSPWVMNHVRAGKKGVIKEIESAGFKLLEDRKFMRGQFYLRFRKQ